jgi:hypothetical protein
MRKWIVALLIIVIDWIIFFVPLGTLFLAYVIIAKPKWFIEFIETI